MNHKEHTMRIALLGLGKMGTPLAHLLQKNGYELTVWNRTAAATQPLGEAGAHVAATPAEAAQQAPILFTMLGDDAATTAVTFGTPNHPGILDAMPPDAIHVSLSTLSVALSRRLGEAHHEKQQHFVAAPVFGRPHVAAQGKLWITAAGATPAMERVRPILESISRGITIVGQEPWRAHALKLGGNFTIAAMIQTLSEAFVFAEAQGIDPALFLETVNTALFQSAFYTQYGQTMLNPPPTPGATVQLGIKDVGLFREAAQQTALRLPLADYIAQQLESAGDTGMSEEDWAVGQYRITQRGARQPKPWPRGTEAAGRPLKKRP
jgi:3-hydroxyisobutyrate dehydrogenase-like beta-hydroxyacid dehydrogenase